jgi:hypothetical protein
MNLKVRTNGIVVNCYIGRMGKEAPLTASFNVPFPSSPVGAGLKESVRDDAFI